MITQRTIDHLTGTLNVAQDAVDRYTERLHRAEPTMWGFVDEIALLVEDGVALRELCRLLPSAGWEQFNQARDRVHTSPIASKYEVQYTFFRHPDKPWRLEIMQIVGGCSPLHAAIAAPGGGQLCVPVHASFKAANEEQYAYAIEVLRDGMGFELAQRCDSTYGRFSYWTRPLSGAVPYLKPRVNLRDTGQEAIF